MSPIENVTSQAVAGSKLKVFVSYSRKDSAFAEELVPGLELCGFDAYLDREDIAPGEPWEERLGRLIRDADTVVFVISPNSIASKHCEWEVAETVKLSKRLVPVVWQVVPDADVPEQLRRLNYIFFTEDRSFTKSLGDLASALRVDLGWIRQHTRFGELAANWEAKGRPNSLLLLGGEIADAKSWLVDRPKDAPQITIEQQAFIDASIRAAEEEQKKAAALQWRAKAWTIAAAVILAIGAAIASVLYVQTLSAKNDLKAKVEELEAANLRLNRKIALRVAPTDTAYFVKPNWYQIASDYSGAIAIVQKLGALKLTGPKADQADLFGPQHLYGTGFIVQGSALYAPWGDDPVFVTASLVVCTQKETCLRPEQAQAIFLGLGENSPPITFGRLLFESPFLNPAEGGSYEKVGVTILRINERLPFGAKPIDKVKRQDFSPFGFGLGAKDEAKSRRPLAIVGFGAGRPEDRAAGFALFLNTLVGAAGSPIYLIYTHVTQPGASGAPVFDIETGEVVAIHHLAHGDTAEGVSIASVIAAIEKALGPKHQVDVAPSAQGDD
jgi:hypothetical protein